MSRTKLVVRRLQQVFIVVSILALAPVIACSSEWSFSVRNDLEQDITIITHDFGDGDSRQGLGRRIEEYRAIDVPAGELIEDNYLAGDPGDYDRIGVLIHTEIQDYYFWIDTDAIEKSQCQVVVTKLMIDFLELHSTEREEFDQDTITVEDPIILNPYFRSIPNKRC